MGVTATLPELSEWTLVEFIDFINSVAMCMAEFI